jgi:hypothetical protein
MQQVKIYGLFGDRSAACVKPSEVGRGKMSDVGWERRFNEWAHPIHFLEDRYGGAYSGGEWLAVAGYAQDNRHGALSRMHENPAQNWGPQSGDVWAAGFWADPPRWIAAGPTPEQALQALKDKNRDLV